MSKVIPVLVEHQTYLEQLYNKNQTIPRVRSDFINNDSIDFTKFFMANNYPVDFGFDVLTHMALHKRASVSMMVGILRHHFGNSQKTADLLLQAINLGFVMWNELTSEFITRYGICDETQRELDLYQYPLPMVIEPKEVKTNKDTGYLFGSSSIILRDNYHEGDVCLDHINRVNKIAFTINQSVAAMISNTWKSLDKAKQGESKKDFEKRKKAFAKYDRTARAVMATLCKYSNKFYLTHRYDKRGRVYAQGYHVNYQGNPWNKAVIEFANQEMING